MLSSLIYSELPFVRPGRDWLVSPVSDSGTAHSLEHISGLIGAGPKQCVRTTGHTRAKGEDDGSPPARLQLLDPLADFLQIF